LTDLLRDAAAGGLEFVDRRERSTHLSWAELARRADARAASLRALGVEPGDRVALVFPTGEEFFEAFFGTLAAGAVPAPLYPPVRLGRLPEYHRRTGAMIEAAGARLVLADRRVRRLLGRAVEIARPALGCLTLDDLPTTPPGSTLPDPTGPSPDDLGLVQFSSGTTVDPKPVALTHRALLAQTRALNSFWPDDDDIVHRGVSWLPLYHDMGLVGCVFPALERGTSLTLLGPELFVARPALWLRALSRAGRDAVVVSPAPNFAYGLCVEKIRDEELDGVDLSNWRVALNGAEAVSPCTLDAFARRFAPWGFRREALTPVYGLSEAALAVTFSDLSAPFSARRFERDSLVVGRTARPAQAATDGGDPRELVSVGRPLPGFTVEIRDEDGRALPDGTVGRLWVSGPSLMDRYLGRPEATARALVDGWLDTGDLGFVEDGELFLTGRAKDVVIVRGANYGPEEIETAATSAQGARVGCAVATSLVADGPEGGDTEALLVFVERDRSASVARDDELATAVRREVLSRVGVAPDRVLVLEPGTLPRTSSGKLRRGETVRRHLAGELEAPAPVNPWRLAAAVVDSTLALSRARRGGER
jgi:acyl-CoA synthetase (AMP-forming)/AMP-acid ligase II